MNFAEASSLISSSSSKYYFPHINNKEQQNNKYFTIFHLWCTLRGKFTLFLLHFFPTWIFIFLFVVLLNSSSSYAASSSNFTFNESDNKQSSTKDNTYINSNPAFLYRIIRHSTNNVVNKYRRLKNVSYKLPFNVILVLPSKESNNDKFGLTSTKARPVIDIAIEDVVKAGIMPEGWINITYHDSRYWEDTLLAERFAATGVVQAYCENRLDAILGFADAYSLATVSKISAGFREGVPVLTTTGLNSQIGSKKSYPYVTRMTGSYSQMAESTYKFIAFNGIYTTAQLPLNYKTLLFMYHDKRRALNRPQIASSKGENADDLISSHCYFSLHAIKNYFKEKSDHFKESWKIQTPYVAFDEELHKTRFEIIEWLKLASEDANGKLFKK